MCGISGYIGREIISEGNIKNAMSSMQNRGPDNQSYEVITQDWGSVVLIHSRLSIIDLDSRSNQPFHRGDCTMIFNGEIYNYVELRNKLIQQGVRLETDSDSEVLIEYYRKYGEKCVDHFEGMWSFAIYDRKNQKLFLSRDRFGEKPLYYFKTDSGFYFASEIKALQAISGVKFTINYNHLYRYLVNGHKSLYKVNQTFYNEVSELDYASNMVIEYPETRVEKYWKPSYNPSMISEKDAIEGVRERLIESVKIRLRSDVPLAFCLSGGVDSASLVSIATKILNNDVTSFSIIDPDSRYNELNNIQATIKDTGCKNHMIELNPEEDYIDKLQKLVQYHDGPVATISYFIHSLLSEAISERGYKISISGTGADEIFTGYYDHFNLLAYQLKNSEFEKVHFDDWKEHIAPFVRNPHLQNYQLYFDNPEFRDHVYLNNDVFQSYLKNDFQEAFTETKYTDNLLRNRMMNEMFHEVVRVILHEDDLNSMKYSIENRSPFLDKSLFEFAYSIPDQHLINKGYSKYLLRESMNGILNDQVRLEREKKGFNASINSIIDFENPSHLEFLLDDSEVFSFVDKEKIENLLKQKEYPNSFKKFLFNFMNAKIFIDQN